MERKVAAHRQAYADGARGHRPIERKMMPARQREGIVKAKSDGRLSRGTQIPEYVPKGCLAGSGPCSTLPLSRGGEWVDKATRLRYYPAILAITRAISIRQPR